MQMLLLTFLLFARASDALASSSFILFHPKGSQIKSELIIGKFKQETFSAPNYFAVDKNNSLLKSIIQSEIEQNQEKRQNPDTQK